MAVNKSFNGTTYSIPTTAGENGWTNLTNFLQALADNAALKTTHKQNVRQAFTSPITISATSDWCVDVRVGSVLAAVTLPTGVEGQTFLVCDGYGLFGSYECTVTPTSGTIQGAGSYIMNHNYQATLFQWSNDRWNIVAEHLGPFIKPEKVGNGTVSFTEFLRLASLASAAVGISDTQTLTNKTISTSSNTVGPLDSVTGTLSASKGGTGLTTVGSALQVLRTNAGATALEWASTGSGDVVGPASAVDNAIVRFDGTTGKLVQNSGATVDDSNNISAASYTATGGTAANNTMYVASNVLRFRGGTSGFGFNNSSGTEVASVTNAGAWTLGPSGFAGTHIANGLLQVSNNLAPGLVLHRANTSASAGIHFSFRNDATGGTSGTELVGFAGTASTGGMDFKFGGISMGSYSATGAWTLGPSSGLTAPHLIQGSQVAGAQCINVWKKAVATGTNNNIYMTFQGATTDDGYIQNNGSGVLSIVDVSDVRWKENIRDATYGLATINALRPVEFDWKHGGAKNVKGFIAQEVKAVLPESVSIKDGNGLEDGHYLETHTMIPVMVKAIQEQQSIIDGLKARIEALENP